MGQADFSLSPGSATEMTVDVQQMALQFFTSNPTFPFPTGESADLLFALSVEFCHPSQEQSFFFISSAPKC